MLKNKKLNRLPFGSLVTKPYSHLTSCFPMQCLGCFTMFLRMTNVKAVGTPVFS